MARGIETKCLHLEEDEGCSNNYGAVSYPIYQTATYAHLGVGKSTGYDYSRLQNPTREHLEKVVAALENGVDALAFSTGMAAITLMMELFSPGDHLIVDADLYGGSIRLFRNESEKNGITFSSIDCYKEDIESYINASTKAVYIETPTNPMMNVTDIEALGKVAKKHNLLLIVDNTFLSPYFQNPLDLGADIVVHSGTKYLGGHNDTLAGFLVTNREDISEKFRFLIKTTGSGLAPFDSWLILRGIKTLGIRMEKSQQNAAVIAEWLKKQNAVTNVIYPGLPTHPGYEIMKKQARGFGAMLTFQLESREFALAILEKVRMIKFAESLGGVETLITYPTTQTHADVPEEIRERNGITGMASVRCGEMGYWNEFAPILNYHTISAYADSIRKYVDMGLLKAASELYYPIRLKPAGENNLESLCQNGVNHIELRMFDLNPLVCAGVEEKDIVFAQLLMVWLAAMKGQPFGEKEQIQAVQNFKNAARYDLKTVNILTPDGRIYSVAHAALKVIERMKEFYGGLSLDVEEILQFEYEKFTDADNRYAWRIRKQFGGGYVKKGLELAKERQGE